MLMLTRLAMAARKGGCAKGWVRERVGARKGGCAKGWGPSLERDYDIAMGVGKEDGRTGR